MRGKPLEAKKKIYIKKTKKKYNNNKNTTITLTTAYNLYTKKYVYKAINDKNESQQEHI